MMSIIRIVMFAILIVKKGGDCRNWKFVEISYPYNGYMYYLNRWEYENTWSAKSTYELPELRQIFNMLNVTQPDEVMTKNDKMLDLNAMKEHPEGMCKCPRVYFPVCATNGISYSNACVMHCTRLNVTVRRDGPCIEYRRMYNDMAYNITLPQHWVMPNATNDKLIELTLLNIDFEDTEETLKNPILRRKRLSQALLDFFDKSLRSNADLRVNVLKS